MGVKEQGEVMYETVIDVVISQKKDGGLVWLRLTLWKFAWNELRQEQQRPLMSLSFVDDVIGAQGNTDVIDSMTA